MPRVSQYEDKRDHLIALIRETQIAHGKPPSLRTLASELGVGLATLHAYLTKAAEEGLVEWSSGRHRTLRCTQRGLQLETSS